MSNINKTEGGGPWILDVPALEPGEYREYHLRGYEYRGRKGYFLPWLPLDNCAIKNRNPENTVRVTFNGQYEVLVESNAADTYGEAGITSIRVENVGIGSVSESDVLLQVSAEPFDADDAARREVSRHPAERMLRGVLGL